MPFLLGRSCKGSRGEKIFYGTNILLFFTVLISLIVQSIALYSPPETYSNTITKKGLIKLSSSVAIIGGGLSILAAIIIFNRKGRN